MATPGLVGAGPGKRPRLVPWLANCSVGMHAEHLSASWPITPWKCVLASGVCRGRLFMEQGLLMTFWEDALLGCEGEGGDPLWCLQF